MKHETFPVAGFEFMNEPATDEQKALIKVAALRLELELTDDWPSPFSKWDAFRMLSELDAQYAAAAWHPAAKNDLDQLIAERDALHEEVCRLKARCGELTQLEYFEGRTTDKAPRNSLRVSVWFRG